MTTAVVTGASGLLGGNLAELFIQNGLQVRATRRGTSRVEHLDDLPIEWREAPLGDVEKLTSAFRGAEVVFHCAAEVSQTRRGSGAHREDNVAGTQSVLAAVRLAGVPRLVHVSSVVACAVAQPGGPDVTEEDAWNFPEHGIADVYAETKRAGELLVLNAARKPESEGGMDAVVVNPGLMIGPRDSKPSSGRIILAIAQGKLPGSTSGTNAFVDVRDVVRGMLLAWKKGRCGERYIIAGINLSYYDAFAMICEELDRRPPRRLPDGLVRVLGFAGDIGEAILRRQLGINSAVARYSICREYRFSSAKAQRELGWTLSPLRPAFRDAIEWFRSRGMLS